MRLLLDNISPEHEAYLTKVIQDLGGSITVLDITEEEEDGAMVRALYASSNDEIASDEEVASFLKSLGK
ncbi:hypothetical protein [Desertivirga arenae]|uniref:hypothetical protein n=1 Tax=Desertivirga arenae TaxID=2810309 RepID=UPI001A96C4F9|nr:hypothetical protein [Pedobacter sp. SYSU D00823]